MSSAQRHQLILIDRPANAPRPPVTLYPGINSNVEDYFDSGPTNSDDIVISFSTPFAHLPDGGTDDFGYVPQALIEWMAKNQDYEGKFPGLASCRPGGPSIAPEECWMPRAFAEMGVPDLIATSIVAMQGDGCFNPVGCPIDTPSKQQVQTTAATLALPASTVRNATPGTKSASMDLRPSATSFVHPQHQSQALIIKGSPSPLASSLHQPLKPSDELKDAPIYIGGKAVVPGAPAVTIAGTTYFIPSTATALFVNGFPSPLSRANARTANGPIGIAGTTLTPGAPPVFISGVPYSIPPTPPPSPLSVKSKSPVIIAGTTLTPGAPPVTIQGTIYSLPSSPDGNPTAIYVNGSPSSLPSIAKTPIAITGTTLTPGAPAVTIQGTTYSLPPLANPNARPTAIYINGSPSPLPPPTVPQPAAVTQVPNLVIGSQTIIAGSPAITIDGQLVSLPAASDAGETGIGEIVVDGTTEKITLPTSDVGNIKITIGSEVVTASVRTASIAATPDGSIGNGTFVGGTGAGAGNATSYSGLASGAPFSSVLPRWKSVLLAMGRASWFYCLCCKVLIRSRSTMVAQRSGVLQARRG
ncbi:MAG: hypothetical protein LQ352_004637 [Teloschistes flavicans]|nr:MAG: hypothetical protein LQ352_004637 [Teloschistes flavicans]